MQDGFLARRFLGRLQNQSRSSPIGFDLRTRNHGFPAGLLGSVLPLWIRDLPQSGPELGRGVGRLLTQTDERGNVVRYAYDTHQQTVTDSLGGGGLKRAA